MLGSGWFRACDFGLWPGSGFKMRPIYISGTHRCWSRQIFGGAKDFCPSLYKLARKAFRQLYVWVYPPTRVIFGITSNEDGLNVILSTLDSTFSRIFRNFAQNFRYFAHIFRDFARIFRVCMDVRQTKNFGCALAPPAIPPPTPVTAQCRIQLG